LKKGKKGIEEVKWRKVDEMVKQGLNLEYYKNIYNKDILDKK